MRMNPTLKLVLMASLQLQDSLRRFIELLRGAIDDDGENTVPISYSHVEVERTAPPARGRGRVRGGGHP